VNTPVQAVALSPARLVVTRDDGESAAYGAAALRRACRCAPCLAARLRGAPAAVEAGVTLVDARPVGHYALQLVFSDGHDRGIYPWAYLAALGAEANTA
jgi:DUF971 family protein